MKITLPDGREAYTMTRVSADEALAIIGESPGDTVGFPLYWWEDYSDDAAPGLQWRFWPQGHEAETGRTDGVVWFRIADK